MAAGSVLIKEAGGFVSDLDGGKRYLNTGHIVAANDQLSRFAAQNPKIGDAIKIFFSA